jgi:hypothetical protein
METIYEIKVYNPDGISKGVLQVSVNNELQPNLTITLVNDRKTHQVEVLMGIAQTC